jgi:hypothetical protein
MWLSDFEGSTAECVNGRPMTILAGRLRLTTILFIIPIMPKLPLLDTFRQDVFHKDRCLTTEDFFLHALLPKRA